MAVYNKSLAEAGLHLMLAASYLTHQPPQPAMLVAVLAYAGLAILSLANQESGPGQPSPDPGGPPDLGLELGQYPSTQAAFPTEQEGCTGEQQQLTCKAAPTPARPATGLSTPGQGFRTTGAVSGSCTLLGPEGEEVRPAKAGQGGVSCEGVEPLSHVL
jgi:hypothetical protein